MADVIAVFTESVERVYPFIINVYVELCIILITLPLILGDVSFQLERNIARWQYTMVIGFCKIFEIVNSILSDHLVNFFGAIIVIPILGICYVKSSNKKVIELWATGDLDKRIIVIRLC